MTLNLNIEPDIKISLSQTFGIESDMEIKAFGILGVSVGLEWKKVQNKFKLLVKKFHPDISAGNKKYEEKLKLITLAYTQLKNTYREKIDSKS